MLEIKTKFLVKILNYLRKEKRQDSILFALALTLSFLIPVILLAVLPNEYAAYFLRDEGVVLIIVIACIVTWIVTKQVKKYLFDNLFAALVNHMKKHGRPRGGSDQGTGVGQAIKVEN